MLKNQEKKTYKICTNYVHKLDTYDSQLQTYKLNTIIQIYTCTYTQNKNTNKHTHTPPNSLPHCPLSPNFKIDKIVCTLPLNHIL